MFKVGDRVKYTGDTRGQRKEIGIGTIVRKEHASGYIVDFIEQETKKCHRLFCYKWFLEPLEGFMLFRRSNGKKAA